MDFATPIEMTRADRVAAAAVRGLNSIDRGSPVEFVIQSIVAKAKGDLSAVAEARRLEWVLTLGSSPEFQYRARRYSGGQPLATGSNTRVLELLAEAESRLR